MTRNCPPDENRTAKAPTAGGQTFADLAIALERRERAILIPAVQPA